jgi:hypothetical protein
VIAAKTLILMRALFFCAFRWNGRHTHAVAENFL